MVAKKGKHRSKKEPQPTADKGTTIDKVKDTLDCPICLERYQNPKALPCLHTFCEKCLTTHADGNNFIQCPTCRVLIEMPPGGVPELPTNYFINRMIDMLATKPNNLNYDCDICDEEAPDPAVCYCPDCARFMCILHSDAHKRSRTTKTHSSFALDDSSFSLPAIKKPPTYCDVHESEEQKLYCDTCEKMICRDCGLQEHREHTFYYLNDAGKKIREHAEGLIEEIKTRITNLEESVHSVKERAQQVLDKCDTTAAAIHDYMVELRKEVQQRMDDRERALLTELKQIGQVKLKRLQVQKTELEAHLKDMKHRNHNIESNLKTITDVDLFKMRESTLEELDDLLHLQIKHTEPLEHDNIHFVAEPDDINTAISIIGRVGGAGEGLTNTGAIQSDDIPVAEYCSLSLKKKTIDKQLVCFVVTLRNQYRNLITRGEELMTIEVTGPQEKVMVHEVTSNNDGTYVVSFEPKDNGKYQISVMIDDEDVDKSPLYYYHNPKESGNDKLGKATSLELEKPNWGRMRRPSLPG